MFGCHFVGGRAEGAPQLRRETGVSHSGVLAVESEHLADKVCQDGWAYPAVVLEEFGGQKVPEAHLHDERVLPHQILVNLEATFPRAIAGKEELEEPEHPDALEERGRAIGQVQRRRPPSTGALAAKAENLKKAETKVAAGVEVDPEIVAVYKKEHAHDASAPYQRGRADVVLSRVAPRRTSTGPISVAGRR